MQTLDNDQLATVTGGELENPIQPRLDLPEIRSGKGRQPESMPQQPQQQPSPPQRDRTPPWLPIAPLGPPF